jgi:hypothetical protein
MTTNLLCLKQALDINFKYYSIDTIYIKTKYKQLLADTITPVSLYFKIRDKFPNSLLLERQRLPLLGLVFPDC